MLRNVAFVQAPPRAAPSTEAVAAGAVLATVPMGAEAFVYKGKDCVLLGLVGELMNWVDWVCVGCLVSRLVA